MSPYPQVRLKPADCEIGDWVAADLVPEWGFAPTYPFTAPGDVGHLRPVWIFALGSYEDDGDRELGYRRIS